MTIPHQPQHQQQQLFDWLIARAAIDYASATHNHEDAAGGGQLNATKVFSAGTVPTARLGSGTASANTCLLGNQTYGNPEGWTVIVASANQDVTNAGQTAHNEFSISAVANGHYAVQIDLLYSASDSTGDFTCQALWASGGLASLTGKGTCQHISTTGAVANTIVTATAGSAFTPIAMGNGGNIDDVHAATLRFGFTIDADDTVTFRFGNASASTGRISRVWKGSVFRYKRID